MQKILYKIWKAIISWFKTETTPSKREAINKERRYIKNEMQRLGFKTKKSYKKWKKRNKFKNN